MSAPPELVIEYVPIDSVRQLRRNPRRGDVEKVRRSMRRWGQYVPIIVRAETSEIVKGNHTWQAAREEGHETIAVIRRPIATDAEAEALAIADNVASDAATWDIPLMAEVLRSDAIEIDATLLDPIDIQGYLTKADQLAQADADAAAAAGLIEPPTPEPPANPRTQPGDRIQLGEDGWLLCGDATSTEDLDQLMDGELAAATFTDPPYGVDYRDTGSGASGLKARLKQKGVIIVPRFEAIEGDDLDADGLLAMLVAAFTNIAEHARPDAALYTAYASSTHTIFEAALGEAGYSIRSQIIWVKNKAAFTMAHYKYRHEPWLYAFRRGKAPAWYGDRTQTTVWEVGVDAPASYQHPTQKPVRLGAQAIVNSSRPGEIILDPFAGSGSALLCAAQLGRRAYGMERSPAYCDVIVGRWEELTGETAKRPRRKRRNRKETP